MKETLRNKINWDNNYFYITDGNIYSEEDLLSDINNKYSPIIENIYFFLFYYPLYSQNNIDIRGI